MSDYLDKRIAELNERDANNKAEALRKKEVAQEQADTARKVAEERRAQITKKWNDDFAVLQEIVKDIAEQKIANISAVMMNSQQGARTRSIDFNVDHAIGTIQNRLSVGFHTERGLVGFSSTQVSDLPTVEITKLTKEMYEEIIMDFIVAIQP